MKIFILNGVYALDLICEYIKLMNVANKTLIFILVSCCLLICVAVLVLLGLITNKFIISGMCLAGAVLVGIAHFTKREKR